MTPELSIRAWYSDLMRSAAMFMDLCRRKLMSTDGIQRVAHEELVVIAAQCRELAKQLVRYAGRLEKTARG